MDIALLLIAATATALATGLGALPVFMLGPAAAERLRPLLLGATVGIMTVASFVGLLWPAIQEGGALEVGGGLVAGIVFLIVARGLVGRREARLLGTGRAGLRTSILVFAVLFVHSLPEGMAIGTAFASDREGLSLFVLVAIALQNVPEGTSIAVLLIAATATALATGLGAIPVFMLGPVAAERLRPLLLGATVGIMTVAVSYTHLTLPTTPYV